MKLKIIYFNYIKNHIFQFNFNYLIQFNSKLYNSIQFKIIYFNKITIQFYKTVLYTAVEKENIEIIKLLLANDKINVNTLNILIFIFNEIKNHIF